MPTSDQQNMSSRSSPSPAPNGSWPFPSRRSVDNSANNGERLDSMNVDVSRILERLGEIENLMGSARRQAPTHAIPGSNAPNPMSNIPPPPPAAVDPHRQPTTSVFHLLYHPKIP